MTDWPSKDRPRKKLLHQGSCALTDAELPVLVLRTGIRSKSVVDLARDLLHAFNALRE